MNIGGCEKHILNVFPQINREKFKIDIHTTRKKGELAFELEKKMISVKNPKNIFILEKAPRLISSRLYFIFYLINIRKLIQKEKYDIIHFFLPESYIAAGLVTLKIPNIKRVMSRRSLNEYQKKHPFLSKIERRLHSRMNAILGNSNAVCNNLLAEGAPSKKVGILYNGVNINPPSKKTPKEDLFLDFGINSHTLIFTIVANLLPYKGHMDLLLALSYIQHLLPQNWVTLVVGRDDGIGRSLQAKSHELGLEKNIRWLGSRSDVLDILEISDIGILSSHEEGFSNAILEGMAASLPMVVTDVGGNKEAVIDGITGYVIPPNNPEAMANAIFTLSRDEELREKMGEAARSRVEDKFSLEHCAKQYENLYEGIIDNPEKSISQILKSPLNEENI